MFRLGCLALLVWLAGCGPKKPEYTYKPPVTELKAATLTGTTWRATPQMGLKVVEEPSIFVSDYGLYHQLVTDGDEFTLTSYGKVVKGKIIFTADKVTLTPETVDGEPADKSEDFKKPITGLCRDDKEAFAVTLRFDEVQFTTVKKTVGDRETSLVGTWEGTTAGNDQPNIFVVFWPDNRFLSDRPNFYGGTWKLSGDILELSAIQTSSGVKEGAKGPHIEIFGTDALTLSHSDQSTGDVVLRRKQ